MYCLKCNTLFYDGDTCPNCKSKKIREVKSDDDIFLIEKEMIWAEQLADILKQNNIPFYYKKVLGAGITSRIGQFAEVYRFFVPYESFDNAEEIVEELFGFNK